MISGMVRRLLEQHTVEAAIEIILDDVVALHGAEYGNVQMPLGDELVLVAQRNLSVGFLNTFRRVFRYDGTACGRALKLGKIVQIVDVERDPEFAAYRMDARRAGFRSVQSAPFLTTDGRLMGVVSTHFVNPHLPTRLEGEMLESYRPIAADTVYRLLGDMPLGVKAEQMSERLYDGISRDAVRVRPDLPNHAP